MLRKIQAGINSFFFNLGFPHFASASKLFKFATNKCDAMFLLHGPQVVLVCNKLSVFEILVCSSLPKVLDLLKLHSFKVFSLNRSFEDSFAALSVAISL